MKLRAELKNLSTLNMSMLELYEKFPQPGQLCDYSNARVTCRPDSPPHADNRAQAQTIAPGAPVGTGDAKQARNRDDWRS